MRTMMLMALIALAGCGEGAKTETAAEKAGAEQGAVYECPMHCKLEGHDEPYTQKEPGECPVCGMELKPQSGE